MFEKIHSSPCAKLPVVERGLLVYFTSSPWFRLPNRLCRHSPYFWQCDKPPRVPDLFPSLSVSSPFLPLSNSTSFSTPLPPHLILSTRSLIGCRQFPVRQVGRQVGVGLEELRLLLVDEANASGILSFHPPFLLIPKPQQERGACGKVRLAKRRRSDRLLSAGRVSEKEKTQCALKLPYSWTPPTHTHTHELKLLHYHSVYKNILPRMLNKFIQVNTIHKQR